jgi:hypothetical protein
VPASGDSEDDCGEQMECRFSGETEVLGENLPQRHFCPSQNPTCHLAEQTTILHLSFNFKKSLEVNWKMQ